MKPVIKSLLLFCSSALLLTSSCAQPERQRTVATAITTETEKKSFGGFSITIPRGWQLAQAGSCTQLSFISWDPARPARQFFYQGTGGYFYLSQQQKQTDLKYVSMGGIRTPLIDKPVISPLTPENFLKNYYQLAGFPDISQGIARVPELYNVQVISVTTHPSPMPGANASAALMRAVFTDRQKTVAREGLFLVTVVPYVLNPMGGPGASLGVAYSFMGITALLGELDGLLQPLEKCLAAFEIQNSYVGNCMQLQDQFTQGVLKAGKTLSETSDMIVKSWQNRSKTDDIISQKRSDAILGHERLYDPSTGTVYRIDNTFLERYRSEPGKYNLNNLRILPPDDHKLWQQPVLQGSDHIRRIN